MDNQPKILVAIAEDHNMFRKFSVRYLRSFENINVIIEAVNGYELMREIERLGILPDVCLVDLAMPVMGGLEVLVKFRERWPSVKCIIVTTYAEDINIINSISNGAWGFLYKGEDPEVLIEAVRTVSENKKFYSDISGRNIIDVVTRKMKGVTFTEDEIAFMHHCCLDLTYREIAKKIGISFRSLDVIREKVFQKLNVNSKVMVVIAAIQLKIFSFQSINEAI